MDRRILVGKIAICSNLFAMKKLLLLLFPKFEEIEALATVDILRRSGLEVVVCRPSTMPDEVVEGAHEIQVATEQILPDNGGDFDGLILPGGPGIFDLRNRSDINQILLPMDRDRKLLAAICAAPLLLDDVKILDGRHFTAHPCAKLARADGGRGVVRDGNLITAGGPGQTFGFALEIVDYLLGEDRCREVTAALGQT